MKTVHKPFSSEDKNKDEKMNKQISLDSLFKEQLRMKAAIQEISDANKKALREINIIVSIFTTVLSILGTAITILGIALIMK